MQLNSLHPTRLASLLTLATMRGRHTMAALGSGAGPAGACWALLVQSTVQALFGRGGIGTALRNARRSGRLCNHRARARCRRWRCEAFRSVSRTRCSEWRRHDASAASAFSLLLPGLERVRRYLAASFRVLAVVVMAMGLGVLLMLGLEEFTPHEHGQERPLRPRLRTFQPHLAVRLRHRAAQPPGRHGIGVSFSQSDMAVGLPLTTAIALQDIPEGLAVALALRGAGFAPRLAVLVAVGTGLLEPLGALIGAGLASGLAVAYPIGLGLRRGDDLHCLARGNSRNPPERPPDPCHAGTGRRLRPDDGAGYLHWAD